MDHQERNEQLTKEKSALVGMVAELQDKVNSLENDLAAKNLSLAMAQEMLQAKDEELATLKNQISDLLEQLDVLKGTLNYRESA